MNHKAKTLVSYILFIFIARTGFADIILQQDFNSDWSTQNPPSGWSIFYQTPTGASDWHREEGTSPWSDNSTGYACLYWKPAETGEDIFTSPALNCSLYTHVNVRCSTYFIPGDGSYTAKLQGTTDGGLNWNLIYDYYGPSLGPTLQVISCPWADCQRSVKFRWYFSGNTGNLYHWSFDNVAITADPVVFDAGVTEIFSPTGTIDSGAVVTPKARVKNFGNVSASCPVNLKIGGFYNDIQYVNLSPGDSTIINFVDWTVTQVGSHAVKCSTALSNDNTRSNDAKTDSVKVRVIDVGVTQIVAPKDTIDSIGIIKPIARVRNYGSASASFSVTFKIGSAYFQSRNKTLAAGIEDTVNFPDWSSSTGNYVTRCSTYLEGDIRHRNDTLGGKVKIRTIDVGATQIIAPAGDIDSTGQTITPQAWVVNNGSEVETFNVTFKIGAIYSQTRAKTLNPSAQDTVNFPSWVPTRGTFATRCSTYLAKDQVHTNDAIAGSVTVNIRDIGITQIVKPTGTIDSSGLITPQVLIKNYGTNTQTVNITMKIGSSYSETRTKSINADLEDTVNFSDWATIRGTYPTRCSLYLTDDFNQSNDTLGGSVTVRVRDVGVVEITAPTGIIDSGATITPISKVSNFGTDITLFPVTFQIGTWVETRNKALLPGQTDTVTFTPWTAQTPGGYQELVYTSLDGDLVPANDSLSDSIFVVVRDVGVTRIVAPANIVTMDSIIPQAMIKNFGTIATGPFEVKFDILPDYSNIQTIPNLNAQESLLVSFSPWAESLGTYTKKCSTRMDGDRNPDNDRCSGTIIVSLTGQPPGSWVEISKPIPGLRPVKDGGCLTVLQETLLFIAKGNKTCDFYCLNTNLNQDTWMKKTDVPWGNGPKIKMVKKGAKMVSDGERYIYLLKGNNTLEFYRYDLTQDSWKSMPNVPLGMGKKIKDGATMAYCKVGDMPFIYLLKGSKTVEFYRFDILGDTWVIMPNAPPGKKIGYKAGSSLTYDPENKILYLLKGVTNEMFSYDVTLDTWIAKPIAGMPLINRLVGKSKKVKAGGSLCLLSPNAIYALKGGNTNEFWFFQPLSGDSGRWSGITSLPDIGTDGKKKKVKDGGDLIALFYHNQPAMIALKGNKTERVWKWATDSTAIFISNDENEIVTKGVSVAENYPLPKFQIKPNPINDQAFIELNLSKLSKVSINIYNIIGQNIYHLKTAKQNETVTINTKNIPAGVYLLKLEADKYQTIKKIIISH